MAHETEKPLSRAIAERRASPSFDGSPIPDSDLLKILQAGLHSPSGYNLQPWRFIVVRSSEQKKKLRAASFNQAKVEEASVVIVACGDADGWRNGDLDEMLRLGRLGVCRRITPNGRKPSFPIILRIIPIWPSGSIARSCWPSPTCY